MHTHIHTYAQGQTSLCSLIFKTVGIAKSLPIFIMPSSIFYKHPFFFMSHQQKYWSHLFKYNITMKHKVKYSQKKCNKPTLSSKKLCTSICIEIQYILLCCELCNKGTVLQRNYWNISCNYFVKFYGQKIWEGQHDCVYGQFHLSRDMRFPTM